MFSTFVTKEALTEICYKERQIHLAFPCNDSYVTTNNELIL